MAPAEDIGTPSVPEMTSGAINSSCPSAVLSNDDDDNGEGNENGTETILDDESNRDEDNISLQMLEDHPLLLSDKQCGKYWHRFLYQIDAYGPRFLFFYP